MSTPKTRPTSASVTDFINAIADPIRRNDCHAISALMQEATGCPPVMWGESIVGFGSHVYAYKSGVALDWPLLGFSPRKGDLSIYLMAGYAERTTLLPRLGKHKSAKACLYVKRLSDIDTEVLKQLLAESIAEIRA